MEDVVKSAYRSRVVDEIDRIPKEYLPSVLQMVRAFREGVTLEKAGASFRRGLEEALAGESHPVSSLWDDLDVE